MNKGLLKKLLAVMMTAVMSVSLVSVIGSVTNGVIGQVEAKAATSGVCGENVTWTLDDDGVLTISGSGAMESYDWSTTPFYGNTDIKKVVIQEGVTSIEAAMFHYCSNLISVEIPSSVTTIENDAFNGCSNLNSIVVDEDNSVYDSRNKCNAIIKTSTNELKVGCNSTVIPNSVTSIGNDAFSGSDIVDIVIPGNVSYIGETAFACCEKLKSITIDEGLTTIERFAFSNCNHLREIVLPRSLEKIGEGAFYECKFFTIYYNGSEEEWNMIKLGEEWNEILNYSSILFGSLGNDEGEDELVEQHTSTSSVLAAVQNDSDLENINKFLSKKKYAVSTGAYPTFAKTENFIIPGLIQTNTVGDICTNMIPQGITKAEQYILISAYCSNHGVISEEEKCSEDHDSVIYVCDLSGNYLKTLVLDGLKTHAGGLAYNYNDKVVYIAHSSDNEANNCVEQLSMDTIKEALKSSKDAVLVTAGEAIPIEGTKASYIFYYGHRLYVGQHSKQEEKNWLTSYAVKKEDIDGKTKIRAGSEDKIYLDAKTQGALIFSRNGEDFLLVSSSLGRNNTSKMYLYNITKAMEDDTEYCLVLKKKKVVPYHFPDMSEDIMLMDGKLYTVFESAGAVYRKNLDGKGVESAPIDRVLLSDMFGIGKLYNAFLINNLWSNLTVSVSSVSDSKEYAGNCGDDLYYDIDKDGNMNINGYGEMYDSPFTEEELEQVKHVYIGHEVLSVGTDAFRGADNLQDVYLSVLSAEEDVFMIGENAFADCPALNAVTLPDKRYTIADSAFDNDEHLQIKSNADDVQYFCEEMKINNHIHQFEYIETVAASPESGGYDLYRCSCGEEEARNATEPDPNAPSLIIEETGATANNIEEAAVELNKYQYILDGQEKKPAITVTYEGNKLKEGTDYTVTYVNNINVGIATVTVTGKGYYTGTKEATFRVQFKDVIDKDLFYYDPIYWAVDNSVVAGWKDGTFRPMNEANRAAVVTFLWRMKGKPEPKGKAKFTDMTGNPDFDKAITWASEQGIVEGWSDGTFKPWRTCNRAAIVTFLWRYAGKPTVNSKAGFKDMTGNSDFDKAISWAAAEGITTGWNDNTFRPWDTCKRLAIVSFLNRYANKLEKFQVRD